MRPSETVRGRGWLQNFLPEDREIATELLDNLMFVRSSTMRSVLVGSLTDFVDSGRISTPALLVPVLSIEDIVGTDDYQATKSSDQPVAYDTFDVGGRISATPGSEGFVGNLIRDLLKALSRTGYWLRPQSTLDQLRTARCRSIVLVTDYAGSGHQILQFARTFTRNATLRSWRSGGFVKLHALAYAASASAKARVMRAGSPIDSFHSVRAAPTFRERPWNADQLARIESFCRREASGRGESLGFQESRGLFATDVGAPNNLPNVLRRTGPGWHPFFEGRTVPPDLAAELGDYSPQVNEDGLVKRTRQVRLAEALEVRFNRAEVKKLLLLLALIGRGIRDPQGLAATTSIPVDRVVELLRSLQNTGLVDDQIRLTTRGHTEVRAGKRLPRQVSFEPTPSSGEYYPWALR